MPRQRVELKLPRHLAAAQSSRHILLVRQDQHRRVAELIFLEHAVQRAACVLHSRWVVAVDDKDEAVRVLEVVPPERADLVLSADVPHVELYLLVLDRLHVETDRWDGVDDLAELELVEDCGLARRVEADLWGEEWERRGGGERERAEKVRVKVRLSFDVCGQVKLRGNERHGCS